MTGYVLIPAKTAWWLTEAIAVYLLGAFVCIPLTDVLRVSPQWVPDTCFMGGTILACAVGMLHRGTVNPVWMFALVFVGHPGGMTALHLLEELGGQKGIIPRFHPLTHLFHAALLLVGTGMMLGVLLWERWDSDELPAPEPAHRATGDDEGEDRPRILR